MTKYNHITTIEIDEIITVVSIDFETDCEGDPTILKMTELTTGDAIAPDLLGEIYNYSLLRELHEFAADMMAEKRVIY